MPVRTRTHAFRALTETGQKLGGHGDYPRRVDNAGAADPQVVADLDDPAIADLDVSHGLVADLRVDRHQGGTLDEVVAAGPTTAPRTAAA